MADDGSGGVTIGIVDPLIVAKGGTGTATLTDHGILLGSGTSAVTPLGVATNGQLPIGSTGADPVLATLTGTTDHVSVTNGAGSITLDLAANTQTLFESFNGTFLETIDFTISESSGTVTGSLEQDGGGDLTQRFSDGYTTLDCTSPQCTINLTAYVGTDTVPKEVFVYILQSAKTVMAASNSDWPATEHIKVANLLLKSAATTGTDGGALTNRNWNDHAKSANDQGHLTHIEERIRQLHAHWKSGAALTLKDQTGATMSTTDSGTAIELVIATGTTYQLHKQTFPAFDMYTTATDDAHIVNQVSDEGGNYITTADLVTDITRYVDGTAAGGAINTNNYFNIVIWGVQNRSGEASHVMINLPTGVYSTSANAVTDANGTSVFDIPQAFEGVGFLIARLTFRLIAGSQWTYIAIEDLRGKEPGISAGVAVSTTDHGLLSGLSDDDHTQYLLADGTRALAGAWDMGSQVLTNVNIDTGDIATAVTNTEWDAAYTHISNNGSDHSFIDQDVTTTGNPQFATIELGHASDTTLTRISAGVVAVEGTNIAMSGGAFHDGFSDFVVNEHIDHTSVTLTAGTGLTGGGDISANRTFAVDGVLEDLDTLGAASADGEFIVATGAGAFAYEAANVARTSLGVGTGDTPEFAGAVLNGPVTVHGNNIITTPQHTGKKERFAGNNGFGQSFPAYVTYEQSAAIAGTRTSDTVFTRTAGSWVVDGLIGQWAYFYAAASYEDGAWLKITDNAAGTITVAGQVIFAGADSVKTCPWRPIQDEYTHGKGGIAFQGGVFDGEYVWLVPANSNVVIKVNAMNGAMTDYAHGQGLDAFHGGAFDGESIWLAPASSSNIIKLDPSDGSMITFAHGKGADAFHGGVFDGENIWLVPYNSSDLVKIDTDGTMTSYAHGEGAAAFKGGVFDGENIWLVPYGGTSDLVKVDPSDGSMTTYAHGKGSGAFVGGVFDGENVWLIPRNSDDLVKVNPSDGTMTSYAHGKGNFAFYGGVFDGESIWLMPTVSDDLVKVNPSDGTMTSFAHGKGNWAFIGGVFDGKYVWMVPADSTEIVRFIPPRFGRVAAIVEVGTIVTGTWEATDIGVEHGGTGRSTSTTAYGLLAAGTTATGAHQTLAAGLTTQILVGGGAAALPTWGTDIPTAVTIGGAYVYRASGTDIPVTDGGTGASSLTDGGIVLGSGAGAVTVLAQATNGQLPIGSTGVDPVLATITGTAKRVVVTNGAGTITLSGPQDLDTVDSPTFANLSLGTGELTTGSINRASGTLTLEVGSVAEQSITSTETTFSGNIVIPDAGYIGSSTDPDAIAIAANGNVTLSQTLTLSALTTGSMLFVGASGLVSQDNSNLFWDNTNKNLGLGTTTPTDIGANTSAISLNSTAANTSGVCIFQRNGTQVSRIGELSGFFSIQDLGSANGMVFDQQSNLPMTWKTNAVERMRVDANGRIGVNTNDPKTIFYAKNTQAGVISYISIDNPGLGQGLAFYYGGTRIGQIAHTITGGDWFLRFNVWNGAAESERLTIDGSNGNVGINEATPETLTEWTHTSPYLTLHNSTHEDSDGGRESRLNFKGEQSGGEETTLVRIQIQHDGAVDDQKGEIILSTNDGSDGDAPTDRLRVDSAGKLRFDTGGAMCYGSCWGNEIGWTQAGAVQNTWYEISDVDMSDGQLSAVTHDGSGQLTVTYAGVYLCNWTLSGETDAEAGTHLQATFSINGTETNDGMNHAETHAADAQIAMAGTAILDLAASATLEVSIRTTDAGTPDISIDHLNITCVEVGGT